VSAKSAATSAPAGELYAVAGSERSDISTARQEPARAFKAAAQNAPKGSPSAGLLADSPPADALKEGERTAAFGDNAKTATGSLIGKGAPPSGQVARSGGGGGAPSQMQTIAPP